MAQTNLYRKPIAEQKAFINSCIKKINEALKDEWLEEIDFKEDAENKIAMISDIHGDLFSLMGSMAQCGFKFQENKFIFYDPEKEEYYYENEDGKYCKYNPNGNPKETKEIVNPQPNDNSKLILSPMVDDSEAHPLLCLGDLLDRSPESTAILILLNTVDKFRALQGDHEFDGSVNLMYMKDQKEATEIVPPILADIKSHDKMPINTYSEKGNNVIEYSHVPTSKAAVVCMFDFLNDYFNGVLAINNCDANRKIRGEVFSALDKEFEKHRNLFNKLRLFINNHEDFEYDKIIGGGNFTIEELLIIKKVIGDALTKSEIDKDGKNREDDFIGLNRFDKLGLPSSRKQDKGKVNIFNFYDDFLDSKNPKNSSVCQCIFGHRDADEVTKYNNNVGIDVRRNEYKNNGTSKANTFVYNKKNGELKIYESKIKRNTNKELEGDVAKSESITIELKDNKTEEPIDKDETEENKVTNYDFSNDVRLVQIDDKYNIKITVSTYDFYNNKKKEDIITIKQPYDEADCVGKSAIFAIFSDENNLNVNDNEKHKEIINNLVENLFKSDKENDKRDFLNLALSNCNNIDTIKYILSLENFKGFITDENKKNFINAALLNKNISVDHLKEIFFDGKEEEFNEYLKNNFIGKEEEDREAEEEANLFMTKLGNIKFSLQEGEENEKKNKDKFFSTIIYTDNVKLLKYLKDKNLLEVKDYATLLKRAAIHNKINIFNEISNKMEEYFGKKLEEKENVVELLNIYIGNKDEELIKKLLAKYKGEGKNVEFDEDKLKLLLQTAIETKDNAFVNEVYKILSNNKVTIKFEKEDSLSLLFAAAIETGNIDIINKVYDDILKKNIEFEEDNLRLLFETAIKTKKINIIDEVHGILKKDKAGVEFKNEDNLKSIFEAAIGIGNTDIINKVCEDIFFNEKVNIEFKKENNLVLLFKAAIKTGNTDIIDKVYGDVFFNEKVSISINEKKDKKEILNNMIGSLLDTFNNSENSDKEINENLFYLIKKIQGANKTEDINFNGIKEEKGKKPLRKLFKMAVINDKKELALKIAEHFENIKTKFDSSDIDTYLKPALETEDINLIKKVFEICEKDVNKENFKKIITDPDDSKKWLNLIKLPNKKVAKTVIEEINKLEFIRSNEKNMSNEEENRVTCFMNNNLYSLLKLSISYDNMDVFNSIVNMYKDKVVITRIKTTKNAEEKKSFNDNIFIKNFNNLLDEAIKTGKAEIVDRVVESYKTVTGEEFNIKNIENLDINILKSLINSGNEEFKKAGWEIVFKNLDKFDFRENVRNSKKFNFNELVKDEKIKNSYFYDIFKYTGLGFKEKEGLDDNYKNSNKNFICNFLKNNYKNYLNNGGKDIELEFNKKGTEILIEYFINNDEPQELKQKVIEFLDKNIFFSLKPIYNNQNNQTDNKDAYKYCKDTNKIEKVIIYYDKSKDGKILADNSLTSKKINYYKTETTKVNDEGNKIATAKITDNEGLKFEFKEGTKIEELETNVNDFFNNIDNNSYYNPYLSYLSYAPLQLQNKNNNLVFKSSCEYTIKSIFDESLKDENKGKTFVCDYADNKARGHQTQIIIHNGKVVIFNALNSMSPKSELTAKGIDGSSIEEFHTINQDGLNCILASKLFFTAVAQEYLAAKNGDFSEFVKDMKELSKFIGKNGNNSKEGVNESNPDNSNYKKYYDLIEIAARANARLLKGAKKQFSRGVDKKFESLAGYFGINQETIQPTDLSKKIEHMKPITKVVPTPTAPTASASKPMEPAKLAQKPASESTESTTPSTTPTEPKKPNPNPAPDDPAPEPKKTLDIRSMPKYLSDRTVEEQEFSLNDFIGKVNKLHKDEKANEDEISFTTDTHGDLVSLMGAAAMCGVKFKEDEFLYYDKVEGVYYEKVGDKYYKYNTMPYTGVKKQGELVGINMGNIIVVPIPDTSHARDLYHLGDVLDRGTESLTSLLFCEVCGSIKLAQGNHEFATDISRGNGGYGGELKSIELALARMKLNGRIATGFYSGKGNNVMSYSHIPLTQKHVEGFFNFLNSTYVDLKYFDKSPSVIEFLDKEFVNQTGNSNLRDKVKSFLITHKNNDFGTIEKVFTKEEMLIIKNVVGDALVKRKIREDENGKITLVDGGFNNIYDDFDELLDDKGENIINFARGNEETAICPTVKGHDANENEIKLVGKCLDVDDCKSSGYRGNETRVTITNLNKNSGEVSNSSSVIKRANNGIVGNFEKSEGEKYEKQTLNEFKLEKIDKDKTTGYDFTNDVKGIEINDNEIAITFKDDKGEKIISFEKDKYQDNLDCNGKNVIFAAVCCKDFITDNKEFIKNLFIEVEEENRIKLLNHILANYNGIGLINEFLDLGLKTKQKKSLVPKTKPVGELDTKGCLVISAISNNKIPNDKISEILKKINNNEEYTKEKFDENFANYKDKICSIIANPNNLKLYRYLSDNNFLDPSYYKELLNSAVEFGNESICGELFKNKGEKYINFSDEEISKLLTIAIKSKNKSLINGVFEVYQNTNKKKLSFNEIKNYLKAKEKKSFNLFTTIVYSDDEIFKFIFDNKLKGEVIDDAIKNDLLLFNCLCNPNKNIAKYLIEEMGADLNYTSTEKGNNPLHASCNSKIKNPELIKYLIDKGVELGVKNNNNLTPIDLIITKNLLNIEEINQLINDKKIKTDYKDKDNNTLLYLACTGKNAELIKYFIYDKKMDLKAKNSSNKAPIDSIIKENLLDAEEIKQLINNEKIDINYINKDNNNLLCLACSSKNPDLELIKYFMDKGFSVNGKESKEIFKSFIDYNFKNYNNYYNFSPDDLKEKTLSFLEVLIKVNKNEKIEINLYDINAQSNAFFYKTKEQLNLITDVIDILYERYYIKEKKGTIKSIKGRIKSLKLESKEAEDLKKIVPSFVKENIFNELESCLSEIAKSPENMELLNKNIDEKIQKQKEEEEKKRQQEEERKRKEEEERKRKEEEEERKKQEEIEIKAREEEEKKRKEEEEKKKQDEAEKKRQKEEEERKRKEEELRKQKDEEERKKKEEEEKRKKENQPPIPPKTPEPTKPQTKDDFEQTYKNLKQKQLKKEIETKFKEKTKEEIKQQKQEETRNIAKTDNIKTVLAERIEEHEKKVKLVNEVTKDANSIKNGSVSVVNKIKEVKGEPSTKQTAIVVKAAKNVNAEDLFNNEDFRNITLDEIKVDGKLYKGFGGKITYSYDNNSDEIRLGFEKGGFFMDQLEGMKFDKNNEYKEVYNIFENGELIFSKQPKIGEKQTLEFMARFKLSPIDAYLWICQDKDISIKGKSGVEINSDKLKEVLTAVTEIRHAMASAIYYTESIKNEVGKQKKDEDESNEEEEKEENEELNNYKKLADFIKECSIKISKENSVNGFGLNVSGVEFKNPIFAAKCLNKVLKIINNKVNDKCKEGEEKVLEEIINNFNSCKDNIEGNKNVILSNCLLKIYGFSLEKAGKKIDNIAKDNVVNLTDF